MKQRNPHYLALLVKKAGAHGKTKKAIRRLEKINTNKEVKNYE